MLDPDNLAKEIRDNIGFFHKTEALKLSPLSPLHPDYGFCPLCGSNNTRTRELLPHRICFTCFHTEEFKTFEESYIGWKNIVLTPNTGVLEELLEEKEDSTTKQTIKPHPPSSNGD